MKTLIEVGPSILFRLDSSRLASDRIRELERILSQVNGVGVTTERRADPVALHLADVPTERIGRYTQALRHDGDEVENDAVDVLTMRLLLNDYRVAVGHLRAVAEIAASLVDKAAPAVRDTERFFKREQLRAKKARARRTSSDAAGSIP